MNQLTEKQIYDLLHIGFGIQTDKKIVQIELDVLKSIVNKTYQLGFKKGQNANGSR